MAERRMLVKKVTDDDNFMALSASAQALYLHLNMSADDDGFCNQVTICMFKAHASVEDLRQLLEKRYLYQFENGVIVIRHWRMANALRKDRYTPTIFKKELEQLKIDERGVYNLYTDDKQMVAERLPDGCQVVAACLPQVRLGKDSIVQDKEREYKRENRRFTPPTLTEVRAYCEERKSTVDPERFVDWYTANGWKVGKNPMKDWKAAIRSWEQRDKAERPAEKTKEQLEHERNDPYLEPLDW